MPEWTVSTIDSSPSVHLGYACKIALDELGRPCILHQFDILDDIRLTRWNGSSWDSYDVGQAEGIPHLQCSIAVDSSGLIHAVWGKSSTPKYELVYGTFDTEWHTSTLDKDNDGYIGQCQGVAIDSSDQPHVAYGYMAESGELRYKKKVGGVWQSAEVVDAYRYGPEAVKIALDPSGNPHILYLDSDWEYRYCYYDGASWHVERFEVISGVGNFDIVVDSSGVVHIIADEWYSGGFYYYKGNYESWESELIVSGGNYIDTYNAAAITLDPYDNPYIVISDAAEDEALFGQIVGGEWSISAITSPEDEYTYAADLVLDSEGYAHVAYASKPSGRIVLKYATARVYEPPEGSNDNPDYRIYDRYGNRKRLPPVISADWELTEGGWFGSANIQISKDFSGLHDFDGFDTLEIWFGGVRRYRGKIICPQQDLQIPESWTLQCMGLADRLNTIIADKRYVYPGGVDVSQAFARLAMDYILTRITPLATDIQEVGFTVENLVFENVSVREAIGSLIEQCAKRAVWGFDVDDAGLDRLFFRPKVDEPVYHYPVGGRVKHYSYPPDYGNIVNTVKLIGSESKYPNLLTNPSFEQPKVADAADGNLVFNPSFELTDGESGLAAWNLSSDAWWMYPGHVPEGDQAWPRTGDKCVELDCVQGPDEYAETKDGAQYNITAGQTYLWEFWHYNPNEGRYRVTATFSDDSVIHFPGADSTYLVMGVGATGKYRRATGQFKAPAGVTWVKLRITQTENSPNFRIDDVVLYQVDGIVQPGWQIQYPASVDDAANDYACDLAAYHGAYSVRLKGYVLAGREIRLIQRYEQRLTIEPSTYYQAAAWVYPMNVARVRLAAWVVKDSGAGRWEYGQSYLLEDLNQWHQLLWNDLGWLSESDDRYAQIALLVIDNTENRDIDLLVDAMYFGLWASDNEINNGVYCPARNYEFELNTDQAFVQNDSRLSAEIKASRTTYGIREARETVAEITDLTQAQNWAIGYFGIKAEPVAAHRCDIVLNDDEVIQPDGQLRLVGSDVPPAFCSRIRYSLRGDNQLSCSVDLNTERPSFEGLLTKVLRQSRSAARDASVSR